MKGLSDPSGFLLSVLQMISDLLVLNLCFLLCCLPVLTIGPAISALYSVFLGSEEDGSVHSVFFRRFRENFRQSFLLWVLLISVGIFLTIDFSLLRFMGGGPVWIRYILGLAGFLLAGTGCYVFPMTARYQSSIFRILKTSFLLSIYKFGHTILLICLAAMPLIFLLLSTDLFAASIILWLLIGFSACCKISTVIVNNAFLSL